MAGTNIELQNPTYTEIFQASRQQQPMYDSPQQQKSMDEISQVSYEMPAVSSLVPELESKEIVSSNIQHVTKR